MARVAGEDGDETADLIARTAERPAEAEFFQTVRLILRAARRADGAQARLGQDARPAAEPLRLLAAAGMRFAAAEITAAQAAEGAKPELTVAFMGLTGPSGVLPDHYSDLVVQRRRARDPALAEFLDLFNHRSLSLFYRAWAKPRLPVRYEEAERPFADPFSVALASAMGLGLGAQRGQASLGDGGLLGLAGSLGRRVRTPGAVRRLAAALLDAPVELSEFQGRWIAIAPGERTRLAAPVPGERTFSQLGAEAVAGVQAWDVQSRFRLRIGPLSLEAFRAFFRPDGPRALLERVVREAVGPAIDFDLQLVLRGEETPPLRLDDAERPALLGQTTWLGSGPPGRDRDESVLPAGALGRL
ncbi:MAG: type VI secretion system baseplate subunit TssG [Caulobacteraceae bacterium]|nr:type VI secretion system baseplate subunit TssG [Caulobacter sp.]